MALTRDFLKDTLNSFMQLQRNSFQVVFSHPLFQEICLFFKTNKQKKNKPLNPNSELLSQNLRISGVLPKNCLNYADIH